MKEFIKWLGINEKIAKVVVWLFIIMVALIIINAALESLGFSNYVITYDNIVKVNTNEVVDTIISCLVCILNFYSITLLVFRIKYVKNIFKYALLYLAIIWLVTETFSYVLAQLFIIVFCSVFCYYYSKKKRKYILFAIASILLNIGIQGIWYLTKARFIDYSSLNETTQAILSLDYFIIMGIIILVKEIYLKKRGERECLEEDQHACYGSVNSKKKENSQKK